MVDRKETLASGAEFSECRTYRYLLWRQWDWHEDFKQVLFIGLNPSTADEHKDDPTLRRCMGFAKDWGYSGLLLMNVFAFCTSEPKALKMSSAPIGPDNDRILNERKAQASLIIAAWGMHCSEEREHQVCKLIGKTIYCLGQTKAGRPRHPLYLRQDTKPELFWTLGE